MDRTHDISFIDFHVKDLATFGNCLTEAANAAFPKGLSRYKEVHVLLLSWEEDNLGVIKEVIELKDVFRETYLYNAEEWRIPRSHSFKALRKRLSKFLDYFEDKESLLIVYYGGHGFMNDDRQCIWSCTGTPGSATVQWSGLQNMFEHAESDALILLDCCAAASSISGTGSGVTEVIAACGFETWAPGVGEHSFTRSLIDELRYWSHRHPLSVAMLHNKVLSRIKYWKPRFGTTGEHEHRKTPIYIVLANEGKQRSIELMPLQPLACPIAELEEPSSSSSGASTESQIDTDENVPDSSQSSIDQVWSDTEFKSPKVLISVALEEDQWLHTDDWIEWLRSVPALVNHAHVEGIFQSGSTLMLLSIPVAIWDLLPQDPAIVFVAFTNSENLLFDNPSLEAVNQQSTKEKDSSFSGASDETCSENSSRLGLSSSRPLVAPQKQLPRRGEKGPIRLSPKLQSKESMRLDGIREAEEPDLKGDRITPTLSQGPGQRSALPIGDEAIALIDEEPEDSSSEPNFRSDLHQRLITRQKGSSFPIQFPGHTDTRQALTRHPLDRLRDYTTVFLVDDSTPMQGFWSETIHLLETCVSGLGASTNYRINFMNFGQEIIDISQLEFFNALVPEGPNLTYQCLCRELDLFIAILEPTTLKEKHKHLGLNLVVLTGSVSGRSATAMVDVIVETANRLAKLGMAKDKVGIQFVQIGIGLSDTQFFDIVDIELNAQQDSLGRNMVDFTRCDGSIADDALCKKILLGAIDNASYQMANQHYNRHNYPHPTNPQLPPSRFSGLSLSTSTATSPPISAFTSPRSAAPMQSPTSALSPTSIGSLGLNASYQMANQHYNRHNYPPVNPADQNPPCNTLYVGNLPIDTSEDELKAMFSKQRGYKRLYFRTKQNGPICFVEFEDISFATKALNELYGHPLHNSVKGGIRLSFSKSPLGVRIGQPGGMGPPTLLSPSGPMLDMNGLGITPFSTVNGPPPGLASPPGLNSPIASMNGMISPTSVGGTFGMEPKK